MNAKPQKAEGRTAVTRDRALHAAIALADAGGIDSLSMRKLAQVLGIEAMSLYYHVKSKDDILDGMVALVVEEMALPAPGEDWKTALRERAESERAVLARHPWAIAQVDARTTRPTMAYHDVMIGCLLAEGFTMPLAAHALSLVDSYVHGFALQEASLPLDKEGDIGAATEAILEQQAAMAESFPHLTQMANTLILQPGYAYGNEFDFGIGLILDGLARARNADSLTPHG
ncbi:hypothetical protein GY21_09715 [Cryobacterium roopkundense]|uniref:AcrR family transcriptional regulator n=1 Tax=Cryobacterium roopkundense TaxID=1001240 RepID=A0A099JAP2_9MICO|nr:TetR/AcrR family transcriptional regulator [Cryobacterium roopkundense]KGJ75396.1 hypothetical protein GY21_09715 [Cryobacterium roopkundense]MBB5639951.1 AcrR family transcriptional regulator [Cryobacterium roopkundense]